MISAQKLKVLIVDDHFLIRQYVSDAFESIGFWSVETARDGAEAVKQIEDARKRVQPYDIVFLDWNMPVMSGFEVLNYFRARKEYADVAFVMLTAESDQKNIMNAIRAGATNYLLKPVTKEALKNHMTEVLNWLDRQRSKKIEAIA